jgi:hypothetical protein
MTRQVGRRMRRPYTTFMVNAYVAKNCVFIRRYPLLSGTPG